MSPSVGCDPLYIISGGGGGGVSNGRVSTL